jgi:hypothetical protein
MKLLGGSRQRVRLSPPQPMLMAEQGATSDAAIGWSTGRAGARRLKGESIGDCIWYCSYDVHDGPRESSQRICPRAPR